MPWNILSVDDNKTIQFLVAGTLTPLGCVIQEAGDGEEALELAKRQKPDLVLLDINMPVLDGVAMLTRLRADPELQAIPVIMLTSWSGQERVAQVARLGVLDYLVKPFTKEQLLEKVGKALPLESRGQATVFVPPRPEPAAEAKALELGKAGPDADSVACLASLVSEQEVNLGEIAKVISRDPTLTARLLRAANPYRAREEDYEVTSVEHALALNGIGCALILTMSDLLQRALSRTFRVMLGITLESVPLSAIAATGEPYVQSEVEFSGKALGRIRLQLTQPSARAVLNQLFSSTPTPGSALPHLDEAVSELTNMVAGNFLSNLADAGLPTRLSPPRVGPAVDGRSSFHGGLSERLALKSPTVAVIVTINIDPWRG